MGTCSHLLFVIMGHISGEHLRKFRETLFWPWTSNCYLTGKNKREKKNSISDADAVHLPEIFPQEP